MFLINYVKLTFLISLFSWCGLQSVALFQLEQINLKQCYKKTDRYSRAVYIDYSQKLAYKVWSVDYCNAPYFEEALKTGFYEELTPLVGVIYDKDDNCRGYVTKLCREVRYSELKYERILPRSDWGRLAKMHLQPSCYKEFLRVLLRRTKEKKYFFADLTIANLVTDNGKMLFIDLEAVRPIKKLHAYPMTKKHLTTLPQDYVLELDKIYMRLGFL